MVEKKGVPVEDQAAREIVLSRVFDAPRELVWEAWTDPLQVVKWWGPKGFSTTIQEMDVKPGGVWRHVMRGPDGKEYLNKSVFSEVAKPERIVFSHSGGSKDDPGAQFEATWTFEAQDAKTKVTIRLLFPTAAMRDSVVKTYNAIEGGNQTLDRLGNQLAKTPIVVERTYNASLKAVWEAITNIEQMKQWYMPALEAFKPEVGFETRFNIHHEGKDFLHVWRVTEVDPGGKIAYSWKYDGYPGDSLVTFELFSEGSLTRLRLTHTGLETFLPDANPGLARGNFAQGWTSLGTSLQQFLEKGTTGQEFIISRVFDAPRELVWKAFTDPEHMKHWWGPKGFTARVAKMDFRPGGTYHYCMRSFDGNDMWGKFVYREIVPPERIVFVNSFSNEKGELTRHPMHPTWPLEMLSVFTFTEEQGKTKFTLTWSPLNATEVEKKTFAEGHKSMMQGWSGTMDQLAGYLEEIQGAGK